MRVGGPIDAAERRAELAEQERERLAAHGGRPTIEGARGWDLALLGHARVVLASIPHLPDAAVRWPAGRRTYADIPVPRGPAELADRIEAVGRRPAPSDPGVRRTYGFFDTADRLGWRAFGLAA
jgi:hypothetical protein